MLFVKVIKSNVEYFQINVVRCLKPVQFSSYVFKSSNVVVVRELYNP